MIFKTSSFLLLLPFLTIGLPLDQIENFSLVFETVKQFYVDEINEKELMNYAITGMINQLDPHSDYMNTEETQRLETATNGKFAGLGLELSIRNGLIEIMSVLNEGPASQANLESHDIILAIDGIFTQGMSLKEASLRIKGEAGSIVALTILKKNTTLPLEIKLERMVIQIPSVYGELIDQQWAYIKVGVFGQQTANQFTSKIKELLFLKPKGFIIDLRNNPGGLLKASTVMANCFLDENKLLNKTIVSTKGRDNKVLINEQVSGNDMIDGRPLVIIINQGSASASEIVAGALQDHHRAVIVGETSFGKGSVQTVIPINGNALKLTSARYFTPAGRSIQAMGIVPDIMASANWQKNLEEHNGIVLKEENLNKHLNTDQSNQYNAKNTQSDFSDDYQIVQAIQAIKAIYSIDKEKN